MASVQTGIAVVYGAPGVITVTGVADLTYYNQSLDFSMNHTTDQVRDADNEVVSLIHSGPTIEGQFTLTPRAKAGTNTKTQAKESLKLIPPGSVLTFASAHEPASTNNWVSAATGWSVTGSRIRFSNNGTAQYEISAIRSPNGDIVTVVS